MIVPITQTLIAQLPGYFFHDATTVIWLAFAIALIPIAGFGITRIRNPAMAGWIAWTFAIASVVTVELVSSDEPSGTRMLLIIAALLWSMKTVVAVEEKMSQLGLRFANWLMFVLFWFGMRPRLFREFPANPKHDWSSYVWRGIVRMIIGGCLIAIAIYLADRFESSNSRWQLWSATGFLMTGLSLLVHFGLFNVLTGIWRGIGVNCNSLFRAPLHSESLSIFWGQRWNLAFSEMTSLAIHRPLKRKLAASKNGHSIAIVAAFVFSGLLHELAISVPVRAGYGLPTLYFTIQGMGMIIESKMSKPRTADNDSSQKIETAKRRLWTLLWVLLPTPLLFHLPFLRGCVWPLIGIDA